MDNKSLMKQEDHPSTSQAYYDHEKHVRNEILQGCALAQQLEQQLNLAPVGSLGEDSDHEARLLFLRLSFDIAAAFHRVTMLLKSKSFGSQQLEVDAYWSKMRFPPGKKIAHGNSSTIAEGLVLTTSNQETPPLSPQGPANVGGRHTPSPTLSSSDMSEGSPTRPNSLELDSENAGEATGTAGRARGKQNAAAEGSEDHASGTGHDNSRKRKLMPKFTIRMPGNNLEQGGETPPHDGHTWRKYGQKEILGARYPRSYYRCTHKNDMGCSAIKQVQKSDDNPKMFEVTYRGNHSCRPAQLDSPLWPFAFPLSIPPLAMPCLQASHCPINPTTLSPTTLFPNSNNNLGGIHFSPPGPLLPPSLFQLPFLSPASQSKPPPLDSNLTLQSSCMPSFPVAAVTPKFETAALHNINFEHTSSLGTSNHLTDLVRSSHSQPSGMACCRSSDTTIDPNQKSSVSRKFECGSFEIPGQNDSIYLEVEKELAVPLSRELENYGMNENLSADSRFSLDFSQIFLPSASQLGTGRLFHGALREQSLLSEADTTQVRTSLDMELLNPPFADDFFCMEE